MKDKVFKVVSQVMSVPKDQVNENSSHETLEKWGSLQHMNLVLALEEEFGTSFSDEEIMKMLDVQTIIDVLGNKGIDV